MRRLFKAITPSSLLLRFAGFTAAGVWVLVAPGYVTRFLHAFCVIALLLNGIPALCVSVFQRNEAHPHSFLSGAVSVAAALLLIAFPGVLTGSLTVTVGLWSLLVGLTQLGYIVQLWLTRERGKPRFLLLAFFSFSVAGILLFSPQSGGLLRVLAGLYLMVYGLWQLIDMIGVLINRNVENSRLLSRVRIKPPVLLTAMLPSVWLVELEKKRDQLTQDLVIRKPTPLKAPVCETLDIVFHLGKKVAYGFGHVDISVRGQTISYGCYDQASNRLFGLLSDGVFMLCPTEPYLEYCRDAERKFLVSFSLAITRAEGDRALQAIRAIVGQCSPWKPLERPEYAFGAAFYKVTRGSFSVYNALRTNCAAMAELLAAKSGLQLLPPNGFVTPGAYFGFLQNELRDPASTVCKQTIYAKAAR